MIQCCTVVELEDFEADDFSAIEALLHDTVTPPAT